MYKPFVRTLLLMLVCDISGMAQAGALPQQLDKLSPRVEQFWHSLAGRDLLKASNFVLPEKKNAFVAAQGNSFLEFAIVGFQFEPNRDQVRVEVRLKSLAGGQAAPTDTIVGDVWIWTRGNWYLDFSASPTAIPGSGSLSVGNKADLTKKAEEQFHLGIETLDVGVVLKDEPNSFKVPLTYSGADSIRIEPATQFGGVNFDRASTASITSASKSFNISVDTEALDGPIDMAVGIEVYSGSISFRKSFRIRGNVFSPIHIQQVPAILEAASGNDLSLIIQNNTDGPISVRNVDTNANFIVKEFPGPIPGGAQGTVKLKQVPESHKLPDRISVILEKPVYGKDTFDYHLHVGITP